MSGSRGGLLPEGLVWSRGCACSGGGAAPGGRRGGVETSLGMATAAGGTHPTGMHSCSCL